jgi:intraflagellar transport protein 74
LAATDEQSTFLAYEKRVKEAAAELTEQQAKLADYNLLVDKLNTDTEVREMTLFINNSARLN